MKKSKNFESWYAECRELSIMVDSVSYPRYFIVADKWDADEVSRILNVEFKDIAPIYGPIKDKDGSINDGMPYYEVTIPKRK
jgi:hypothetical protein